jgi:hypothetical protein
MKDEEMLLGPEEVILEGWGTVRTEVRVRIVNIENFVSGFGVGWDISQPGGHSAVNGGFTEISSSFIIIEHSQGKPPEGCEPCDGGFFMVGQHCALVKRRYGIRCISKASQRGHPLRVHQVAKPFQKIAQAFR